ncbi:hypothetical protein GC102_22940 [Paenibacillus sp. LMG 31460]|uniref:Uncharacterized protein n=1 Tax=Paenibacillus germinis TaxID=2654979 RepID=A0ABX1Z5P1_9BACL|nr:hypothetical protein [Paenibacillus germinis]NOU88586.1 hypothetical protein [Paenibacillus germinis]
MKKKIVAWSLSLFIFLASSITAYAASTVIIYDGGNLFYFDGLSTNSTSCGYDGKMRYVNQDTAHFNSLGKWRVNPTGSGIDNYYVYIPSCNSNASVVYSAFAKNGDRGDININQANYSNVWYYLGSYDVEPNNITQSISLYSHDIYSGVVGWDEAKFTN